MQPECDNHYRVMSKVSAVASQIVELPPVPMAACDQTGALSQRFRIPHAEQNKGPDSKHSIWSSGGRRNKPLRLWHILRKSYLFSNINTL